MAANELFDWRASDRRLYLIAAIGFPLIVLIGFGRTYYLKEFTGAPPLPSLLVHAHGLVMSTWVAFFIAQVMLIRTKNAKTHMKLGVLGVALASLVVIVGFFTAASAAKYGSISAPPDIPPLSFLAVPFFDLVYFVIVFGAAIYFRKKLATHKRLMLMTAINFLPPAVARIPVASLQSLGPLLFFGLPAILTIGLLIYDRIHTGRTNRAFLIAGMGLIISYPLRMLIAGTPAWLSFATWVTSWAA